jgi:hypothetical protein
VLSRATWKKARFQIDPAAVLNLNEDARRVTGWRSSEAPEETDQWCAVKKPDRLVVVHSQKADWRWCAGKKRTGSGAQWRTLTGITGSRSSNAVAHDDVTAVAQQPMKTWRWRHDENEEEEQSDVEELRDEKPRTIRMKIYVWRSARKNRGKREIIISGSIYHVMNNTCIHLRDKSSNIYMYKKERIYKEPLKKYNNRKS